METNSTIVLAALLVAYKAIELALELVKRIQPRGPRK